jgi:hypothetical protein
MVRCVHCGNDKPASAFPANPRKRNGFSSWCRGCHNEARDRSYERKVERLVAERLKEHAEWMAEWRENMRRNRETMGRRTDGGPRPSARRGPPIKGAWQLLGTAAKTRR